MTMATTNKLRIRWILAKDLHDVGEVEKLSFNKAWKEDEFIACLKHKSTNGLVAEIHGKVIAFLLFDVKRKRVQLLNMAVHPDCRRQGIATALITKLLGNLTGANCIRVTASLRESNLTAQMFFKAAGFTATGIVKGFYTDSKEDAYQFEKYLRKTEETTVTE